MNANNAIADMTRNRGSHPIVGEGVTPDKWEGVVKQLVGGLRFGIVQITVHESQVVQVERTEKVRFARPISQKT